MRGETGGSAAMAMPMPRSGQWRTAATSLRDLLATGELDLDAFQHRAGYCQGRRPQPAVEWWQWRCRRSVQPFQHRGQAKTRIERGGVALQLQARGIGKFLRADIAQRERQWRRGLGERRVAA